MAVQGNRNAGYILVDLDRAQDNIIDTMRSSKHEPCAVLRTSRAICKLGFMSVRRR